MTTIQHRRGTEAQWSASTRPLEPGEVGVATDGDEAVKVGDGVTLWDALPTRVLPGGGTADQVLTSDGSGGVTWEDPTGAVDSVNGETGAVTLSASDVGADASGTAAGAVSAHAAQQGSGLHLPTGGSENQVPLKGASGSTVAWGQMTAALVTFTPTAENTATNVQDAIEGAAAPVRVMTWSGTEYEPAGAQVTIWVGPIHPEDDTGPYGTEWVEGLDIRIGTETP